jgi:hypothetical protein
VAFTSLQSIETAAKRLLESHTLDEWLGIACERAWQTLRGRV